MELHNYVHNRLIYINYIIIYPSGGWRKQTPRGNRDRLVLHSAITVCVLFFCF